MNERHSYFSPTEVCGSSWHLLFIFSSFAWMAENGPQITHYPPWHSSVPTACLVGGSRNTARTPAHPQHNKQAQVRNAPLSTGCLHSSSRSGTQNAGRTHAAKSKPSIFQGCYFIYNPGELLGATGICPNIPASQGRRAQYLAQMKA